MRLAIAALALALAAASCVLGPGTPATPRPMPLFEQPWHWTDERGVDAVFSQWRGAPLVVTAFFTSCTTRCPITVTKLFELDASLRRRGVASQFALVTLDPQVDDPARLLRFKESRHLPESWHLLRGSLEQTRELGRMLGVRALRDDGHIDHDVRVAVFDKRGDLVQAFSGWSFDEATVTAAR